MAGERIKFDNSDPRDVIGYVCKKGIGTSMSDHANSVRTNSSEGVSMRKLTAGLTYSHVSRTVIPNAELLHKQ